MLISSTKHILFWHHRYVGIRKNIRIKNKTHTQLLLSLILYAMSQSLIESPLHDE